MATDTRVAFAPKEDRLSNERVWDAITAVDVNTLRAGASLSAMAMDQLQATLSVLLGVRLADDAALTEAENIRRLGKAGQVLQLAHEATSQQAESDYTDVESKLDEVVSELREKEAELEGLEAKVDELSEELRAGGSSAELESSRFSELERELAQLRERNDSLERDVRTAEEREQKERDRSERVEAELRKFREVNEDLEHRLRSSEEEQGILRTKLTQYERRKGGAEDASLKTRSDLLKKNNDRLQKEMLAVERSNAEVQRKYDESQREGLQLSEAVVTLDEQVKQLKAEKDVLDNGTAQLEKEKLELTERAGVFEVQARERAELLEAFEAKFARQHREWESRLTAAEMHGAGAPGAMIPGSPGVSVATAPADVHEALADAREKEILLLEAYEQLERDTAKEVDAALAKQRAKMDRMNRESERNKKSLGTASKRMSKMEEDMSKMKEKYEEAERQNARYEAGVFGLAEAMGDVKRLRAEMRTNNHRQEQLVKQLNAVSDRLEDAVEENRIVRRRAGMSEDEKVNIGDLKLRRHVEISQLRSLNSQLEREISELEEERRRLREELRLHARLEGETASRAGLTAHQLELVDEFAQGLRAGDGDVEDGRSRVVGKLEAQVNNLTKRLAETQAKLALSPEAMARLNRGNAGEAMSSEALLRASQDLDAATAAAGSQPRATATDTSAMQAEYRRLSELISQMMAQQQPQPQQNMMLLPAPAQAPVSRPATAATDAYGIEAETRLDDLRASAPALPVGAAGSAVAPVAATAAPFSAHNYSTASPSSASVHEVHALRAQLIEALRELEARDEQHAGAERDLVAYRRQIQRTTEQLQFLHREHARLRSEWDIEKSRLESDLRQKNNDLTEAKAEAATQKSLVESMTSASASSEGEIELRTHLQKAFGRLAVESVKCERAIRALSVAVESEQRSQRHVRELEEQLADIASAASARVAQNEAMRSALERRCEVMEKVCAVSVPKDVHDALVRKHTELTHEFERLAREIKLDGVARTDVGALRAEAEGATAALRACEEQRMLLQVQLRELQKAVDAGKAEGGAAAASMAAAEELSVLRHSAEAAELRANRAIADYESALESKRGLEMRVAELEAEVHELVAQVHASPGGGSTSAAGAADALRSALGNRDISLELMGLSAESAEWKERATVAEGRLSALSARQEALVATAGSLRQALGEITRGKESEAVLTIAQDELARCHSREASLQHQIAMQRRETELLRDEVTKLSEAAKAAPAATGGIQSVSAGGDARTKAYMRSEDRAAASLSAALASLQRRCRDLEERETRSGEEKGQLRARVEEAEHRLASATSAAEIRGGTTTEAVRRALDLQEEVLTLRLQVVQLTRRSDAAESKLKHIEEHSMIEAKRLRDAEALTLEAQKKAAKEASDERLRAEHLEEELRRLETEMSTRRVGSSHNGSLLPAGYGADMKSEDRNLMLDQVEAIRSLKQALSDERERRAASDLMASNAEERVALLESERDSLLAKLKMLADDVGGDGTGGASSSAAQHVAEVAQQTIDRLQGLLKERDGQLERAQALLARLRSDYLEQQQSGNREVERLNAMLSDKTDASLRELGQQRAPRSPRGQRSPRGAPPSSPGVNKSTEFSNKAMRELRTLLSQREQHIETLKKQLDKAHHHAKDLEDQLMRESIARKNEGDALRVELKKASKAPSKALDSLGSRMRTSVHEKDRMIEKLKSSVKEIGARLEDALHKLADYKKQEAAVREADEANKRNATLMKKVSALEAELQKLREADKTLSAKNAQLSESLGKALTGKTRLEAALRRAAKTPTGAVPPSGLSSTKRGADTRSELQSDLDEARKRQLAEARPQSTGEDAPAEKRQRSAVPGAPTSTDATATDGSSSSSNAAAAAAAAARIPELEARIRTLETANAKLKASLSAATSAAQHTSTPKASTSGSPEAGMSADRERELKAKIEKQWSENKRLEEKVRVQQRQLQQRETELQKLEADLARSRTAITRLQHSQPRAGASGSSKTTSVPGADREKIRELNSQLAEVEQRSLGEIQQRERRIHELEGLLSSARTSPRPAAARGGNVDDEGRRLGAEGDVFELRLEKQTLEAKIASLQREIDDYRKHETLSRRGGAGPSTDRRAVAEMERALEASRDVIKATQDGTRREKEQTEKYRLQCDNLKMEIRQMKEAHRGVEGDRKAELAAKREELLTLRSELEIALAAQHKAVEAATRRRGESSGAASGAQAEAEYLRRGVADLERTVAALTNENSHLKTELSAFDDEFWTELEDLKWSHSKLTKLAERYREKYGELTIE
ncbi:centrosomal protein [Pycnococcus provasolii]